MQLLLCRLVVAEVKRLLGGHKLIVEVSPMPVKRAELPTPVLEQCPTSLSERAFRSSELTSRTDPSGSPKPRSISRSSLLTHESSRTEPFRRAESSLVTRNFAIHHLRQGSGKGIASPQSPPLRTGRAPFRRIRLKHETTHPQARGESPWSGGPPARYANRAGSRCASVVAAAPARTVTVPPTFLHCRLTPVGCPLTCVHTRGK